MRAFFLFLPAVLVPSLLSVALLGGRGAENPVTNGGFEVLGPGGFPADWEPVGGPPDSEIGVCSDAHSGKYSLRLARLKDTPRETGLNRAWKPFSGERGAMLSQLKGAISFWYKALSAKGGARLVFYVIPMSAKPLEDTGLPRAYYVVPESHIGDGKWHRGIVAYDFTSSPKVKWVQVSPRIVRGTGEWLLDDISYVERAGPVPQIQEVKLIEAEGREGEECTLRVKVRNAGDEPARFPVEISLPEGLRTEGGRNVKATPEVRPGDWEEVEFKILGLRVGEGRMLVSARYGEWEADRKVELSPRVVARMLRPERFILSPGEEFRLDLVLRNEGNSCARGISATLSNVKGIEALDPSGKRLGLLRPGREGVVSWRAKAGGKETLDAKAEATVEFEGRRQTVEARLFVLGFSKSLEGIRIPGKEGALLADYMIGRVAALQTEKARILFPSTKFGFGMALLQVRREGRWETVGKMPYLARLTFGSPGGGKVDKFVFGKPEARGRALVVRSKFADGLGGTWEVVATFEPTADPEVISATYELRCDRQRQLLRFEGPMLYIGEGSFGSKKEEAVFPGLEWLVRGEESSSALDIAPDHPDRIRYVPHPNKVTVPAVGVYNRGVCAGLMWDPLQRWDGEHTRPLCCFASPDWFEGRNAHLVGLFLPSGMWVEENEREASKPYPLRPGRPLTLKAEVILDGDAKDALSALDKWFSLHGVTEPLPPPHGSLEAEVAFCTRAYFKSLWVPEERKWWTTKHGHPLLSRKARPPAYLFDLYMASTIVEDRELARRCKEFADEVMRESPGLRPVGPDEFGFAWADPLQALIGMAGRASSLIRDQNPDGTWSFRAVKKAPGGVFEGRDYRELGPDGAVEVGTCARRAYEVLRFARMTGDREALEAGLKALEAMRRFRVPRAAQVWEIPVHTPDILAAADAVDAYLEGYAATGDRRWLEEARKWARRGLPFVYVWNVPEFPFMRYASIPVFGATWFRGSWFGRAVQWNGLRFAYALLKLSDHDRTFPWRRIAEGLTVSAMYQQEQGGEDVALWPDSISIITGKKARWVFSPAQILKCVYKLLGRDPEPTTRVVKAKGGEIRITTRGDIPSASFDGGTLRASLRYPPGQPGNVVVFGVKPRRSPEAVSVEADGRGLPRLKRSDAYGEEGWFVSPAHSALLVRLPRGGSVNLTISGVEPAPVSLLPKPVREIRFEFDRDVEGWIAAHDVADLGVADGCLTGVASGPDPYLVRPFVEVEGGKCPKVRIRMSVTGGTSAQFYWTTADSPDFAEDKSLHFKVVPDGRFHIYELDTGSHPMWRGKRITAIRLDPTSGAPGAVFKVDWIRGGR